MLHCITVYCISSHCKVFYRVVMYFVVLYIVAMYCGCLIGRAPLVENRHRWKKDVTLRTIERYFAEAIFYQTFQINGITSWLCSNS